MSVEQYIFDERNNGEFNLRWYCWEYGHTYIRIKPCPNGICMNCGTLAQGVLEKVKKRAYYRDFQKRMGKIGRRCDFCNVEIGWDHRHSYRVLLDKTFLCSPKCRTKYLMSFKPLSEGSMKSPPVRWSFSGFRSIVLKRDNHTCQECGEIQDLEVHHILPRAEGGSDHPENLITLCEKCHAKKRNKRYHAQMSAMTKCVKLEQFL